MAGPFYVDDGGDNTAGTSWATAKNAFVDGVALLSAGEDLYVGHNTIEAVGATQTWSFPGTATDPNRVISVTQGGITYSKASAAQVDNSSGVFDMVVSGHVKFYVPWPTRSSRREINPRARMLSMSLSIPTQSMTFCRKRKFSM